MKIRQVLLPENCAPLTGIPGECVMSNDEAGMIASIVPVQQANSTGREALDLRACRVMPGLIDSHQHGGRGVSFEEGADEAAMHAHANWLASHGVTGYLRSISAENVPALQALIREHVQQMKSHRQGAMPLGLHLEGPWLNPAKAGAFSAQRLGLPDMDQLWQLLDAGQGWIRMVTLAPELPNAAKMASLLRTAGVVCALGHSDATYELASEALADDFTHVTHTFNAQSGFHHRQPGVVGAVLASSHATAEVIADGRHVHAGALKLLYRCLGPDRIILVSDAMSAAGMPDGEYALVGQKLRVANGVACTENGSLAGSTTTLERCLPVMSAAIAAPWAEVVAMATINPARLLGVSERMGVLRPGKLANLTALDADNQTALTMIQGKLIYSTL